MSLFAVSDLHVWGPDDPLYHSLLALLNERAAPGDTVVLAGDLFDLFVGNKRIFRERYQGFFEALGAAGRRGVHTHYIEGNHDFLIRRAFRGIAGLQIHAHEVSLELGGRRFYFAHGDMADRGDYGYRALRLLLRSPILKAFVAVAPGELVDRIGRGSSKRSSRYRPRLPTDLPAGRMERLRRVYRSYAAEKLAQGYDFVVLGHCHDLDEMSFQIGGRPGQYVNIGFPRAHGSLLSWQPGEDRIHREALPKLPVMA
ncbi:MAG TPA: UDP-2,3-diacylglucosamine diphosphatase [Bdellovibrionota bacterium]|nr:UDP-2,3-diacylglucosamine diphosphatase [Bdellovibrionota bacterium]